MADTYRQYCGGEPIVIGEPTQPQDNHLVPFTYSIDKFKSTGFKLTGDVEKEILKTLEICQKFQEERVSNG